MQDLYTRAKPKNSTTSSIDVCWKQLQYQVQHLYCSRVTMVNSVYCVPGCKSIKCIFCLRQWIYKCIKVIQLANWLSYITYTAWKRVTSSIFSRKTLMWIKPNIFVFKYMRMYIYEFNSKAIRGMLVFPTSKCALPLHQTFCFSSKRL